MKLIDRYVAEVGRRLPLMMGRADIEKELRSTLEDMLEDRAQKAGRPVDETMEIDLLKEYGSPGKIAATYNPYTNPHPYLIGPHMFPFFIMILRLVVFWATVGLSIVTCIQIVTQMPMTGNELFNIIGNGIGNIISTDIEAFGYIVLTFAILERFVSASEFKINEEEEWNPASLLKEPDPGNIKLWEPILTIVFTIIGLSILNFNPQLIGIHSFDGQEWSSTPIFTGAFFRWLPLINVNGVAGIILNIMLFRAGHWNMSTRIFSIGIKIVQIVIGYLLLTGPSILAVTPASLLASGVFDPDTAQTLGSLAQNGVQALIGLTIFISSIEVVNAIYKLVMQRSPAST